MAEPFGILGGIALLIQTSVKIGGYIKGVKGSSSDRQKLLSEINSTAALCQTLQDFVEINGEKDWASTLKLLNNDSGPIAQLQECLNLLERKLVSTSSKDNCMKALRWPFDKKEIQDILVTIERQKSLLQTAQQNDHLQLSLAIQSDNHDIARGVNSLLLDQEKQKKKLSLSRLTSIDFDVTHTDINSRRLQGTGSWLLKSPEYVSWLDQPSTLWCRGIPGAGKTILSSLVIQTLRDSNQPDVGVAGLYCSYRNPETILNMLGSLVKQLAEPLAELPVALHNLAVPRLEDFRSILSELFSLYSKVMIVIDALDECVNRIELLRELNESIQRKHGTEVHILITSRSGIVDIERGLKASVRLEIQSHDDDSQTYLRHRLREQHPMSDWVTENPDFEVLIMEAIMKRMNGMFLLARLYIDLLLGIPTRRGVRKALESLPEGSEDTYTEAWARICAQRPHYAELGKRTLSWLVHAARPLRTREILHALAIDEDDDEFYEEGLSDITTLTSSCAGLVILDEQQGFVSLVHPTAQEYLQERRTIFFPNGHEDIAKTCITYLLLKKFRDTGPCSEIEKLTERWSTYPFLGYAAVNWGYHVKHAESKNAFHFTTRLLENDKARIAAKQALVLNIAGAHSSGTEWPSGSTDHDHTDIIYSNASLEAIHLAAFFGLDKIVDEVISAGGAVNATDHYNATAIFWALCGDQNGVLRLLLERGADANAVSSFTSLRRWPMAGGMPLPLCLAAYQGNTAAIRLLLQYGANINKRDSRAGETSMALSAALLGQQDAAVSVLLDNGANVNVDGIEFISSASLDVLKKFVAAGLSKEVIQEALLSAAARAKYDKIKFFLEHGADANGTYQSRSEFDETLNSSNDESGEKSTTWKSAKNKEPFTPLVTLIAHKYGSPDDVPRVLNLLIDAGADVNRNARCPYSNEHDYSFEGFRESINGWSCRRQRKTTPLMTAAYYGMIDVVNTLIKRGASINVVVEGKTALTSAIDGDGLRRTPIDTRHLVELLIEQGADPQLCDAQVVKRIQKLLAMSSEERKTMTAFQNLLSLGGVERDLWFYYHQRTFRERRRLLKQLIEEGADPALCCAPDQVELQTIMNWSEQEVEERDRKGEEFLDEQERSIRGPLSQI